MGRMTENPFPGMNPYLESRWGDVHARLVAYAADALQDGLPPDLRARMQERVFIESDAIAQRAFSPDVHVYEGIRGGAGPTAATSSTAVAEPLVIHLPETEIPETYLEIIDARSGGRVVTIIEFVSRSNKAFGAGRQLYKQKQSDARQASTNLVEIDLLRGGYPATLAAPEVVPPENWATYHASVWRAVRPLLLDYYPIPLRQRLPRIRIPLRSTDPDVVLDLQELVNLSYRRGRYDDIDYTRPPEPPLQEQDAEWARTVTASPSRA